MTHVFSAVLVNQRSEIERLANLVEQFGDAHHLSADDVVGINLVMDEIIINVIAHAYDDARVHRIPVSVTLEGTQVTIQVEDDGRPFNPLEAPPPNLDLPIEQRPIGGLGIYIVMSNVDAIAYRRERGWNVLTMKKTICGA